MGRDRSRGQYTVEQCRNMRGQIQTILRQKELSLEQKIVLIEPIRQKLLLAGVKELPHALRGEPAASAFTPMQTANPTVTQQQKPYKRGDDPELDSILNKLDANRIPDSFPQVSDEELKGEIKRLINLKVHNPDNPADCTSTLYTNGEKIKMAANDPRLPWDAGRKTSLADAMRRERWEATGKIL